MFEVKFNDYESFADTVYAVYKEVIKDDYMNDVSIIAGSAEARIIIKEFVKHGIDLRSVILEDYDDYTDEYVITLLDIDGKGVPEIWCEKMKREDGYIYDYATYIFVLKNCDNRVYDYLDTSNILSANIGKLDCNSCINCMKSYDDSNSFAKALVR